MFAVLHVSAQCWTLNAPQETSLIHFFCVCVCVHACARLFCFKGARLAVSLSEGLVLTVTQEMLLMMNQTCSLQTVAAFPTVTNSTRLALKQSSVSQVFALNCLSLFLLSLTVNTLVPRRTPPS